MRIRDYFVTALLLLLTATGAATLSWLLFSGVNKDSLLAFGNIDKHELQSLHDELEYVVFAFTASAGLLALLTYWNSCAADRSQKQLEKRKYLETFHRRFLKQHEDVILAFEWPDEKEFRKYLELCKVALKHEKPPEQRKQTARRLSMGERRKLRRFDNFLEEFAFLNCALQQGTVSSDAVMLYFDYYIKILHRAYKRKEKKENRSALKKWVNKYWPRSITHLMTERKSFKKQEKGRRCIIRYSSRLGYLVCGLIAYALLIGGLLYAAVFIATMGMPPGLHAGKGGFTTAAVIFDSVLLWVLALQFHGMAGPLFKKWEASYIPRPMVRTAYVAATAVLLWLWAFLWRPLPQTIWDVTNSEARRALGELYVAGWLAAACGVFMTNSFNPCNLKVLYAYLRSDSNALFRFKTWICHPWARYPFMLGLQLALWAAPTMTLGRLLLACSVSIWFLAEVLVRNFEPRMHRVGA